MTLYNPNLDLINVIVYTKFGFLPFILKILSRNKILTSVNRSNLQRTSFHKGGFLGPEYFNNILGTNSHIKGTCIAANFESNGPLVWCLLSIKSGWGNYIPVLPEVMN